MQVPRRNDRSRGQRQLTLRWGYLWPIRGHDLNPLIIRVKADVKVLFSRKVVKDSIRGISGSQLWFLVECRSLIFFLLS